MQFLVVHFEGEVENLKWVHTIVISSIQIWKINDNGSLPIGSILFLGYYLEESIWNGYSTFFKYMKVDYTPEVGPDVLHPTSEKSK